ncbi:O-antigen ligase family protein [Afipia carboxidovorans]|nr:O-antigen ligase family protein [Afipia carboxidovorans]
MLWLIGISSSIVFIEPSPYEVMVLLAIIFFVATGLKFAPPLLVPTVLLIVLNSGYAISAIKLMDQQVIIFWILTSCYMALTAIFFAVVMLEDTKERLDALSRGYVIGAVIASLAGIAGYFQLIPGATDLLTFASRARGTFKDPNVLGAFLVYPAIYCICQIIESPFWKAARNTFALCIICMAIFLAFSRGAWAIFVAASIITTTLMYLTATTRKRRVKIVMLVLTAVALAALAIFIMLSFSSTADLFSERASLSQPYDSGRYGRFGRHILGAIMTLDYPFGIGPLQFHKFFPEDTHNSFLNAFMSGGWLSGVVYPALFFTTLIYAIRGLFVRTPWRSIYIAVFATFLVTLGESFIIDTDHWRHYFLLVGLVWGTVIAGHRLKPLHGFTADVQFAYDLNRTRPRHPTEATPSQALAATASCAQSRSDGLKQTARHQQRDERPRYPYPRLPGSSFEISQLNP